MTRNTSNMKQGRRRMERRGSHITGNLESTDEFDFTVRVSREVTSQALGRIIIGCSFPVRKGGEIPITSYPLFLFFFSFFFLFILWIPPLPPLSDFPPTPVDTETTNQPTTTTRHTRLRWVHYYYYYCYLLCSLQIRFEGNENNDNDNLGKLILSLS
ncbi:hypothetical protein F4775DRAFT_474432 [Biscogniauxia sp. FL1348]|nr:hypothetical protein F4775DRAFT_474432 [Biscogniauxia sp. FL1348]